MNLTQRLAHYYWSEHTKTSTATSSFRKEGGSSGGGSGSEGGDAKPRVSSTGGLLQAMSDGWQNPNMAS